MEEIDNYPSKSESFVVSPKHRGDKNTISLYIMQATSLLQGYNLYPRYTKGKKKGGVISRKQSPVSVATLRPQSTFRGQEVHNTIPSVFQFI